MFLAFDKLLMRSIPETDECSIRVILQSTVIMGWYSGMETCNVINELCAIGLTIAIIVRFRGHPCHS